MKVSIPPHYTWWEVDIALATRTRRISRCRTLCWCPSLRRRRCFRRCWPWWFNSDRRDALVSIAGDAQDAAAVAEAPQEWKYFALLVCDSEIVYCDSIGIETPRNACDFRRVLCMQRSCGKNMKVNCSIGIENVPGCLWLCRARRVQ